MSYVRVRIDEHVSIDIDDVWSEIEDDDFIEEAKARGMTIQEGGIMGDLTPKSRRLPPQSNHDKLCLMLDLPSLTSKDLLIKHIQEMI